MASSVEEKLQVLVILLLVLLIISSATFSSSHSSIVETLPGYSGPLPFNLQTGYIGVGENEELQLFYYFIESQSQPTKDPLLLWVNGGPGCSGFSGLVYEIGPLVFDTQDYDGSFPSLTINPYSWTRIASIIFIDSPVGTGFSYSTSSQGYDDSNDTKSAKNCYLFLKKWLSIHPMFLKNRLYIAGDSYGGKIVPMIALNIVLANEDGVEPQMFLQGYSVGNSITDIKKDENQIVPYQHRMALISDEYFELAKSSCDGEYKNPDPSNILCLYALQFIKQCTNNVNTGHVLEPKCKFMSPHMPEDDPVGLLFLSKEDESWCRHYNYVSSYVWANNETVREALHVRKGTKRDWKRCNKSLSYEQDVESVFQHHQLLNQKGIQALVYSGDHDMVIPYMSTLQWIRQLNLTLDDNWRAWSVDGQVAGYTERYKNNQAYLIFATVKGAGHTAPEYKPKECFAMIKRWLSLYPL